MSWEKEDLLFLASTVASSSPVSHHTKLRISYTRDFFLSLRDLDVCKKLPSDIDKSIISDIEEATSAGFERQRSAGKLSLQGSKRGEYSLQSNSISTKGNSTRWDTRSSGTSDWEEDLHSERESLTQDSGKRYGNQNRRAWQPSEHDGLLGSGALVKPPGFTAASVSKTRANGQYQLNRSTESYQPPRPYKAPVHSHKGGNDFCNDETFGSSEGSNEDRAQEERKRRESFELMRKEQQKVLQEKSSIDVHKGNHDMNIVGLADSSDTDKNTNSRSKTEESVSIIFSPSDPYKSKSLVHNSAARPLVPPGFASALIEKNLKVNKLKINAKHPAEADEVENLSVASLVVSNVDFGKTSANKSGFEKVNDSLHKRESGSYRVHAVTIDHSTSFLEKLFKYSSTENSTSVTSDDIQNHADGADGDSCTDFASKSSKFAHFFHEKNEGNMHIEDKSSRDLLSLIINKENNDLQVSKPTNDEATDNNKSSQPSEYVTVLSSPASSSIVGMPLEFYQSEEQRPSSVLTCEDLEHSILAEVKDRCSANQYMEESWTTAAVAPKCENHIDFVNDHASHHLLSLLQRGENSQEPFESSRIDDAIGNFDMHASTYVESSFHLHPTDNASPGHSEEFHSLEKGLTLEDLFGSAFMSELHSMEAPISAQKKLTSDSDAFHSYGLPFNLSDGLTSTTNEQHPKKVAFEGETVQSNNSKEHIKAHSSAGNRPGFRDSFLHGFKFGDLVSEQATGDIHLPEEDSLISLNDSFNTAAASGSLSFQNVNRNESIVHEKMMTEDLSDNLLHAILSAGKYSRESTVDYPSFARASLQTVDCNSDHHDLQARPSLQASHQMSHGIPSFTSHLDYHMPRKSHLTFVDQNSTRHDHSHPFTSNVFAHQSYDSISPNFEHISAHHNMLQALPLSGNFQSNSVQVFPGVPHSINQGLNFAQEINLLPLQYQQSYYGGVGMGIHGGHGSGGAAIGRPSPEASLFERLKEMEMRANSKQFHPSKAEHLPGLFYSSELDTNLHYM